jgi:hypothetical protein
MSKWLTSRPAKYIDVINVIVDAINERWILASTSSDLPDDYEYLSRLTVPFKVDSRRSNNVVFAKKKDICSAIRTFFCGMIIFPEDKKKEWAQLYPVNYDNVDSVIENILYNAGFDPECFSELEDRTQYPYEDDFFEACYYLLNNYLLYLSDYFVVDSSYIVKKTDTATGETEYLDTPQYPNRLIVENAGFYKYRFYQGRMKVFAKGPLFPSKFRLKVPVRAVARRATGAYEEVTYEQIFSFVGYEADAPTIANEHFDFDSFHIIYEDMGIETYYGTNMRNSMISTDSLILPNYKHYDPPQ